MDDALFAEMRSDAAAEDVQELRTDSTPIGPGSAGRIIPKLLVSVRDVAEAEQALAGGAQILDIKDPSQGALGRADWRQIVAIARDAGMWCEAVSEKRPVTAALGEAIEWLDPTGVRYRDGGPALNRELIDGVSELRSAGLSLLKLGPYRLAELDDWPAQLLAIVRAVNERLVGTSDSTVGGVRTIDRDPQAEPHVAPGWVAVCYADWQTACAPSPDDIIEFVRNSAPAGTFRGVLIDTFDKQSGRLTDLLTVDQLREISDRVRSAGLFLALAGRLSLNELPAALLANPDVVAIRSAACSGGNRNQAVCSSAVCRFIAAVEESVAAGTQR